MHRYREFGLISEQDEALRRAFRDGFKRAGLSFAQFLDTLAWYRDHARPAADEAQLADAFAQFAADGGWPAEQRDGVLDLYRTVRDNGPAAVIHRRSREGVARFLCGRSPEKPVDGRSIQPGGSLVFRHAGSAGGPTRPRRRGSQAR